MITGMRDVAFSQCVAAVCRSSFFPDGFVEIFPGTHRNENVVLSHNRETADIEEERKGERERENKRERKGEEENAGEISRETEGVRKNEFGVPTAGRRGGRLNKRAGLPGTGSRGIMIILGVGKE